MGSNSCAIMYLNESQDKHLNLGLVKQEAPDSDDIQVQSFQHEMCTIKSETVVSAEHKFKSANLNALEPEVIRNWSLEIKSETLDQGCDVESDLNISIKEELLHEELDIKSEDETRQETRENELPKHTTILSEVDSFNCHICNYNFGRKNDLNRHLRIHTGEKPFECNICGFCTARNSSLKTHLKTHTGEKRFKCTICDYRTVRKCDLKTHLKTHAGEKSLKYSRI